MPKKILIIEDEELLADLLQKKLAISGYQIFLEKDGERGLSAMRELRPDLVLLDILMPKMDGLEVLARIRKEDDLRKIPVIVISNSGQPVEISKIKELGVKDWLVKTDFNLQEIMQKVRKQIGD
jgi:DNA-binding response OmpR family regulator